jgi:hypothetical protein
MYRNFMSFGRKSQRKQGSKVKVGETLYMLPPSLLSEAWSFTVKKHCNFTRVCRRIFQS